MGAYCCSSQETADDDFSIQNEITNNSVVVFSKTGCSNSLRAKTLLYSIDANPKIIEVSKRTYKLKEELRALTNHENFPYVYIEGKYIGGYNELEEAVNKGSLNKFKKSGN